MQRQTICFRRLSAQPATKFRIHLDFGDGKVGQFHRKGPVVTKIVDCESDIVQSDFPGSVCRKIKVLNDLGALDGYDHASEGDATVVPRRELRVCDRRILAAKRTQSIDSPGLAN
jgi:hypothetical protein